MSPIEHPIRLNFFGHYKLGAATAIFIGFLFLIGGIYLSIRHWQFYAHGVPTQGIIIENVPHHPEPHKESYQSVGSFQDQTGKMHSFSTSAWSNPPAYQIGQHVPVLYDPAYPDDVCIADFSELWLTPLAFLLIGLALFLFPLVMWIRDERCKQQNAWLLAHGLPIQTRFQDLYFSYQRGAPYKHTAATIRTTGRHPHTGENQSFESNRFWIRRGDHIRELADVTVYIDPNNPSRYWMDLRFLEF